ncbi:MAG: prepilin-type N-terminal cleavage/methylation domain-containing protein [Akkermansiaceae bacterium]|jgi:prepilin-type N-terminal cleavage/methylation domain-containing protein|nr:prepilin-type N-terminal cleavage/methylation domain-containing protein [Akkermansiaceae bacterium]MCU0777771.1 prepilin-type N-terminal cleavage/methylation domain-containing protein [Akkermansiaceae bacterium]
MIMRNHRRSSGFTLVELMVAIVVVAALATATLTAVGSFRVKAAGVNELARMRGIGVALFGWAGEHQGRLPRSSHSATGHGELGWQREILPHLGYPDTSRAALALARTREFGMDPAEGLPRGPALNVYYELNPEYDDYEGAPRQWRNPGSISKPSATVLAVMAFGTADHIMAQYFNSRVENLPAPGKGAEKGCVLWYDGSATLESPGAVFDPSRGIDRFHPDKAR